MLLSTLRLKRKFLFLLLLIIILLITISVLLFLILKSSSSPSDKSDKIETYIKEQSFEEYIPKDRLEKALTVISNPNASADEKYQSLGYIAYYLQDAYYKTNDPKIRKLIDEFDSETQKAFSDKHFEDAFTVACADSECGETPDAEAKDILNEIQNLTVDELYINTISLNLENAFHVPYISETTRINKLNLYRLSYLQLLEIGNIKASGSAERLKSYVLKKYSKDISDVESYAE